MIRPARPEDLPDMTRMAARFFDASGLDRWFAFEPESFARTAARLIENPLAMVLLGVRNDSPIGMMAALAYPCWFDDDHMTAQELFWWVEPEERGGPLGRDMRKALEKWAKDSGCLTMEMGALEAQRPELLAKIYARDGYAPKERIFCTRIQ